MAQSFFEQDGKKMTAKYQSERSELEEDFRAQKTLKRIDAVTKKHSSRHPYNPLFSMEGQPIPDAIKATKDDPFNYDGELMVAILELQKLIKQSKKLDQKVVTLEEALAEAKKRGIDIGKPQQQMPPADLLKQLLNGQNL